MIFNDIDTIRTEFGNKECFTLQDLEGVLRLLYPSLSDSTLRWKVHDLKEKEIIWHVARGVYSLKKPKWSYFPDISPDAEELYMNIRQQFRYARICMSHTRWFNEFMLHQVFKTFLIIEVEKDAMESVFYWLLDQDKKVFLNPERKMFGYYITSTENPIIVKPLISESPLIEMDTIKVASLEKLLVDCLIDREIYIAQNSEMSYIFENATNKYTLNTSRLLRYARRRNRFSEITDLINRFK